MTYEVYLLIAMSFLLIWAAIADWRTGIIPRAASYMLLFIAIVWLYAHGLKWEALFVGIIVIRPARKPWTYIAELSGVVLVVIRGFSEEALLLVVAVFVVQVLFDSKIWRGGDAQVAIAVVAVILNSWFFLAFTLIYASVAMVISLRRFGIKGSGLRFKSILSKDKETVEEDMGKISIPWVVLASVCALFYIWIYPGLLITIIGRL